MVSYAPMMNYIQNPNGKCEDAPCCGCCGYEAASDEYEPLGSFDCSDDGEALASAGYGTDEDYGCFDGGEDSFLDSYYESQTECDYGE